MVVLAIGPKVFRFKPGLEDGFLRMLNVHSMTSFRGEAKLLAPCYKFLWHIKNPLRYVRDINRQNVGAISHCFSALHY
jgi:hypothetical protein